MKIKDRIEKLEQKYSDIEIPLPGYEGYENIRGGTCSVFFNKEGKIAKEKEADHAVVHAEFPHGGERYMHRLFFVDDKGSTKFFEIDDKLNYQIIKMQKQDRAYKTAKVWHHFADEDKDTTIFRRFRQIEQLGDSIVVPYNRGYNKQDTGEWWRGMIGSKEELIRGDDGMVIYNPITKEVISIDKLNKARKVCGFNVKPDLMKINGKAIEENDHIDFLGKLKDEIIYDSVKVIDIYFPERWEMICEEYEVNPFIKDEDLKKLYAENLSDAGPQTMHQIKRYDIKTGITKDVGSFSDPARAAYYWYVEPRIQQGIITAMSRDGKEKREIMVGGKSK